MRHYLSSHYSLMGRLTHVPPLAMVAEGGAEGGGGSIMVSYVSGIISVLRGCLVAAEGEGGVG